MAKIRIFSTLVLLEFLLLATRAIGAIVELDHHNLADAFKERPWTCVLFYDHSDAINTPRHLNVLNEMEKVAASKLKDDDNYPSVTYAQLDVRKHWLYRQIYNTPNVVDEMAIGYTRDQFKDPTAFMVNSPETLMNFQLGDVYFPAKLFLFTSDFDVQEAKDLTMFNTISPGLQSIHFEKWIYSATKPLKDEDDRPAPTMLSNPHKERERDAKYHEFKDNSFDFETYLEECESEKELKEVMEEQDKPKPDLRELLELGPDPAELMKRNISPFIFPRMAINDAPVADYFLFMMGRMIDVHLAWLEGYETTWTEERKIREDEVTNFGTHLKTLNNELVALIDRVLDENSTSHTAPYFQKNIERDPELALRMEIPNLKPYLFDVVLGMGRTASTFRQVIDEMIQTMGATAEERRINRYKFNGTEFPIVQRLREYMEVFVQVHTDHLRFSVTLQELVGGWHSLLREFHKSLTNSYQSYLMSRTRVHKNEFQFMPMDVLDMQSPDDYEMLTNYEAFHKKYTETGMPVVLANVNMTNEVYTLEHIVNTCPSLDVSSSVKLSYRVAQDNAPTEWGGLADYELNDLLLNEKRKAHATNSEDGENSNEEEEISNMSGQEAAPILGEYGQNIGEDGVDRSITMEQFAILQKRLPDHLYLHDQCIPDECDGLLYDETIYDSNQKFRIPFVIGSYDLFQRLEQSTYANTWPTLFVGRQGSNSKLHIDSGATGFYMYLVSGRKRWIAYNRQERPFLYESLDASHFIADVLGAGKSNEANNFLSARFPLLHRAEYAYEIIQEPGQLVYIPPNCPHAVENLEDTIGLAMNFVSKTGTPHHILDQVLLKSLYIIQTVMTYLLFEKEADKPFKTEDPLYTTFAEFKAQF